MKLKRFNEMNYFFEYNNSSYKINYNDKPYEIYGMLGYGIEFRENKPANNKVIGDAALSIENPTFKDINTGDDVLIELKQDEMYLIGIKVKDKFIGKGIGKIFLNMIFDEFKISKLYFYSVNHPYWDRIATKLDGLSCNGGDVYTLTKEQISFK